MIYDLLKYYSIKIAGRHFTPVAVKAISLDYHLYLYEIGVQWLVVVETDYLSGMPGIAKDVEAAFGVRVKGWLTLKSKDAGEKLLSPDSDDYDPEGTNDENQDNFVRAILSQNGVRYGVLEVVPESKT